MGETRRRTLPVVITALGALSLIAAAGCSSTSSPRPSSTPSPSGTAALLAEMIDAYTPFNAAFDLFLSGEAPDVALKGRVTTAFIEQLQQEEIDQPRSTVTEGASSFSDAKLVDTAITPLDDDVALVVCRDVSQTRLVDAQTHEVVTMPDRRLKIPTVVSMIRDDASREGVLVMGVDQWNEDGYCQ